MWKCSILYCSSLFPLHGVDFLFFILIICSQQLGLVVMCEICGQLQIRLFSYTSECNEIPCSHETHRGNNVDPVRINTYSLSTYHLPGIAPLLLFFSNFLPPTSVSSMEWGIHLFFPIEHCSIIFTNAVPHLYFLPCVQHSHVIPCIPKHWWDLTQIGSHFSGYLTLVCKHDCEYMFRVFFTS